MDSERWMKLLADAPPRDAGTAEEFGGLLVKWAYERLRKWYGERVEWDLALRQELGEVVSRFTQSVVANGFACLHRVPPPRREAYLCVILRRCVAWHFGRENGHKERQPFIADESAGEDEESDEDDFASADPGPEDLSIRRAVWDEIQAVVATMRKPRRAVFHDRYEVGFTARETAHHLRLPLGTVQWHDREILITLRRHFGRGADGGAAP